MKPMQDTLQHTLQHFTDRILQASQTGKALRLRGGGTKDFLGQSLQGEVLDTRAYSGILSYEPSELVITVRCGTPLAEVEAALAEKGQSFAFEPPHFGEGATIGGMVAAGLSGPARASVGTVRDFVLGARVINGKGEHLTFGGQVMKNVAGYDVSRLLAGSWGQLGLITEVSLKVLPVAPGEATLVCAGVSQAHWVLTRKIVSAKALKSSATCSTRIRPSKSRTRIRKSSACCARRSYVGVCGCESSASFETHQPMGRSAAATQCQRVGARHHRNARARLFLCAFAWRCRCRRCRGDQDECRRASLGRASHTHGQRRCGRRLDSQWRANVGFLQST